MHENLLVRLAPRLKQVQRREVQGRLGPKDSLQPDPRLGRFRALTGSVCSGFPHGESRPAPCSTVAREDTLDDERDGASLDGIEALDHAAPRAWNASSSHRRSDPSLSALTVRAPKSRRAHWID